MGTSSTEEALTAVQHQHVGVTAKITSPLRAFLQNSTSTDTECGRDFPKNTKTRYEKLFSETSAHTVESESPTDDASKILYEMKTHREETSSDTKRRATPSKIEFQLYRKQRKTTQRNRKLPTARKTIKKQPAPANDCYVNCKPSPEKRSIFQKLTNPLTKMTDNPTAVPESGEPQPINEVRVHIYPFDHGCADYLHTTDCPPHILSEVLAERATHYATRFWSEFFGSLYIGVAFLVTFILQTYKFLLYSLVNTLIVGFLHMTSDYLVKPFIAAVFNGFLQPPLILFFNVLTSVRDLLEPVAETLNNFLKPVANVFGAVRLVEVNYNKRKTQMLKDV